MGVLESLDLVPQSVACAARTMRLALAAAKDWKFTVRSTMVLISYASIAGATTVTAGSPGTSAFPPAWSKYRR